ncbi:MAG: phage holin family protein [Burkholderiaceae bacterium]
MDIRDESVARGGASASPPPDQGAVPPRGAASAQVPPRAPSATRPIQPQPSAAKPSIAQFIEEIKAAFNARFYLFELEAKRAAWSAAYMLAFAVGAALLGVTAWLILIGALIVGAVAVGVPAWVAVVVAIALHAVGVFLLIRGIRSLVENLTFSATRRTLSNHDEKVSHGSRA